jgi:hypothetical protein
VVVVHRLFPQLNAHVAPIPEIEHGLPVSA